MIGSTTGLTWENPKAGDEFKDSIDLNVSAPNSDYDIAFYYDTGSETHIENSSVGGDGYATVNWDSSNAGTGEFTLKANNGTVNETISVTADFEEPNVDSFSPSDDGYTNEGDIDISYSSSDDHSSIDYQNISIEGENESSESNSLDDISLDDGDYTVNYWVNDTVSNVNNGSWDFTVDTSYDGPEDFSFDPSPGNIDVDEEDRQIEVTLEDENSDDTDIDVECLVDGNSEHDFTIDTGEGEDDTFECDIDDAFDGSSFDLELDLEDQAGNSYTSDSFEFGFDALSPSVSYIESVEGVSVFGDDFEIDYSVSDDVSDISTVEYYINEDPGIDEGTQFSEASDEVMVSTSDLDKGNHTLYLRGEDEFGKWSSTKSFDFEYYPDEKPVGNLTADKQLNVTANSSKDLEVEIENTGRILIPSSEVSVSSFGSNTSFGNVPPNESETVYVELSPTDEDIGSHNLTVEVSDINASAEVNVIVKANDEMQNNLESALEDYNDRYNDLSSRVEELKPRLSKERTQRLESKFSKLESAVEEAKDANESGEYYRIDEVSGIIESRVQSVRDTADTVEKEQNVADRNLLLLSVFGLFVLIIGAGVAFVLYSDQYEFDFPELPTIKAGEEDDEGYSSDEIDKDSDLAGKLRDTVNDLKPVQEADSEDEDPDYEFK